MKTRKKSTTIFILMLSLLFSCIKIEEKQIRNTTCTKTSDYAYLDDYVKGSPCTDSLCVLYQNIWKQIFMEKNGLTDDYFNKHITLYGSGIGDWDEGTSFSICYEVTVDWAIAYTCDQFIIKINEGNNLYPSLNLPRGTYLTKEKIMAAVDGYAFSSEIIKLSNAETLKFDSMDNAIKILAEKANVNMLCPLEIRIDKSTGELILEAWTQLDYKNNKCVQAIANLMNGETSTVDTPCYIIN